MLCISANRISYFFGFRGPSAALDSACSASLAALAIGARSTCAGECSFSLIAGVHVQLQINGFIDMARAGVLARRGRSRTFDQSADGLARSEACCAVLCMM